MSEKVKFLRYSLFWDVTQRRLVVSDILEQPVSAIFKVQIVQDVGN